MSLGSLPTTNATPLRAVIPSERERALGIQAGSFESASDAWLEPEESSRPSLRELLRQFSPRGVTAGGPLFPLVFLMASAFIAAFDGVKWLGPEIKDYFGYDIQFLFQLGTAVSIAGLFLGPLGGFLADRIPRVWMLRVGLLLTALAALAMPVFATMPALIASTLLAGTQNRPGMLAGVTAQAGQPLLFDYYSPRSRARIIAFLSIAVVSMDIIGFPIAGGLAQSMGWRTTSLVFGVLGLIVGLGAFWLKEPVRGESDRREMGASEEVARHAPPPMSLAESWRATWAVRTVRRQYIAEPFIAVASIGTSTLVAFYLANDLHLDVRARSLFFLPGAIAALIALVLGGAISDRLLAERPGRVMAIIGIFTGLSALSTLTLVLTKSPIVAAIALIPTGFVITVVTPAQLAVTSMVIPARVRGFALSARAPFTVIGSLLGTFVVAPVAQSRGYGAGLMILVPFAFIGAVIYSASALGVDRDIRAALAASMAEEDAAKALREGRNKMLVCRDVDVTYEGVQVLFGVDFDVEEGDLVALMGTNGAGKSTLLRAICGLQEASNGAVFFDGRDITHVPPYENARNGVVMMPGGHAVFPGLTVAENLRTAAWLHRKDEEFVRDRQAELLELFPRLGERLDVPAGDLSGGEQQMLALAQTLLMKPRLLMIDELSLGLAPQVVDQLLAALRAIHDQGTTVVVVEQSFNRAQRLAQRSVFMEKGEIRFEGATDELAGRDDLVRSVFVGQAVTRSSLGSRRHEAAVGEGAAAEQLLCVDGVSVHYGGVTAVSNASLVCAPGEVVGLIGANGAGKTTLFDVISGFAEPSEGRVLFDGQDITRLSPDARARAGLIRSFQDVRLFSTLTLRENIAVAFERRGETRNVILAALWAPHVRRAEQRINRRVDNLIESLGLSAFADKFLGELSTGSRRIAEIACLLATEPRLLLLDEPSSGLAQAETEALGPLLARVVKETGCGVLVIEHDLPLVSAVSDRLVYLELGQTVLTGPPAEVLASERVRSAYSGASLDDAVPA